MAGTCISCSNEEYKNRAKAQAAEYLNGYDLLRAERYARMQNFSDEISGASIAYWDSLLLEAKYKEAYTKGQQMIRDSAEGKFFRKNKYKADLETIVNTNVLENVKEEYSKYVDARTFLKQRENAPTKNNRANEFPYQTHYWNLITIAGKQQEAYNKGANDARKELNKSNSIDQ